MDKLSKDELLKLLANSEKPRKSRKAVDLDEDKKVAMLERLAAMRETVKLNREAKKSLVVDAQKEKEQAIDAVFEKKYGSKFDRMSELLTDLNENTKEVVKMKREKLAKKAEVKEPEAKPAEVKLEVKDIAKPLAAAPPKPFPIPNRPIFAKCNTRF